jgi:adenylylsulfate kinase
MENFIQDCISGVEERQRRDASALPFLRLFLRVGLVTLLSMSRTSSNTTFHDTTVSSADREGLNGHRGAVLWFTGLSGSGKSTLANAVESLLAERRCHTYLLDGDNVRHGLNGDLGFSAEDRAENIRRLAEAAALFVDAGLLVLTAFISPYRKDRQAARDRVPDGRFVEIFCDCSLETCEERDPKGLYKQARSGDIEDFTGISAPYEAPENPELRIDTGRESVADAAQRILAFLEEAGLLNV